MKLPNPLTGFEGMHIDDVRASSGYVQPPADLELQLDAFSDDGLREWKRLQDWFDKNTSCSIDAMCVYLADTRGVSLIEAAAIDADYGAGYRAEFDHN